MLLLKHFALVPPSPSVERWRQLWVYLCWCMRIRIFGCRVYEWITKNCKFSDPLHSGSAFQSLLAIVLIVGKDRRLLATIWCTIIGFKDKLSKKQIQFQNRIVGTVQILSNQALTFFKPTHQVCNQILRIKCTNFIS